MFESSGSRLRLVNRFTRRRAKQVVAAALCAASFLTGQLLFGADPEPLLVLNPYLQPTDAAAGQESGARSREPGGRSQATWNGGLGVVLSARGSERTFGSAPNEPIANPTLPARGSLPIIISPANASPLRNIARPGAVVGDEGVRDQRGDDLTMADFAGADLVTLSKPAEPLWIENTTISPKLVKVQPLELESPAPNQKSPPQKSSRAPRRARLSISDDEAFLPGVTPAADLPGPAKELGTAGGEPGFGNRGSGVGSRESDEKTAAATWMQDIRSALNPR